MFALRYVLSGMRARLPFWLSGVLLIAVATAFSSVVVSATRATMAADRATMGMLARLGADLIVTRDAPASPPKMVGDLPEGTHSTVGSVYSLALIDTATEIGRDFSHISLPIEWCGSFEADEVDALRAWEGVSGVSGVLFAACDSVSERLEKVEVAGETFDPDRAVIDEQGERDLEAVVQADPAYAALAAEQAAIFEKPEQELTAADQARLEELAVLLGTRRAEIYHERRPDVFAEPVVREEQRIEPPTPQVVSDSFLVAGIAQENRYLSAQDIVEGEYFAAEEARDVAIVKQSFAQARSLSVGDTIAVPGKSLLVVGIARMSLGENAPDVLVPLRVLQAHLTSEGQLNVLFIDTVSGAAASDVRNRLASSYSDIRVSELSEVTAALPVAVDRRVLVLSRYGWVLAAVLAVMSASLLGLMGVRTVTKRGREIATLRAIGWPALRVAVMCVAETVIIVTVGLVLGMGAAVASLARLDVAPAAPTVDPMSSTAFLANLTSQDVDGADEHLSPIATARLQRPDAAAVAVVAGIGIGIAAVASGVTVWRLHRLELIAQLGSS